MQNNTISRVICQKMQCESSSQSDVLKRNELRNEEDVEYDLEEDKLPFDSDESDEDMSDSDFDYASDRDEGVSDSEIRTIDAKLPDLEENTDFEDDHDAFEDDEDYSDSESDLDYSDMPGLTVENNPNRNMFQMSDEEQRIWLEVIPKRFPSIFVRRADFARANDGA